MERRLRRMSSLAADTGIASACMFDVELLMLLDCHDCVPAIESPKANCCHSGTVLTVRPMVLLKLLRLKQYLFTEL